MTKIYRHELKYYINQHTYQYLRKKLQLALSLDTHTVHETGYWIRSLYFDSFDDLCYADKLDGVQSRKKYRIRLYDMKDTFIAFEIKSKEGEYVSKHAVQISKKDALAIISGNYHFLLACGDGELAKAYSIFMMQMYKPKVIVDYQREAYTFPANKVRITFDKFLRGSKDIDSFFSKDIVTTFPLVEKEKMILEVKYNDFLPGFIKQILIIAQHDRRAISKYTLAREAFELSTKTF